MLVVSTLAQYEGYEGYHGHEGYHHASVHHQAHQSLEQHHGEEYEVDYHVRTFTAQDLSCILSIVVVCPELRSCDVRII